MTIAGKKRPAAAAAGDGGDEFVSLLAEAGCNLLSQGPTVVTRDLQQRLQLTLKGADASIVANFVAGLESHVADDGNLHRLLMPMVVNGKSVDARPLCSLARVLLSVPPLQTAVTNILLEKLPEHIGDDCTSGGHLPALIDSIPRLILSQFRFLNFLVDSHSMTEKLLEILSICPFALKKEIITFLPEVIVDSEHEMVVRALEQLLQEDLQLIVTVLDAFSSLNLEEDLFDQVVNLALGSLRTADAEDLPLIVKFLLQSATSTNVKQIVQKLRENLQFVTVSDVRASKPDRKQKGKSSAPSSEALILDAIQSGLQVQNLICDAFLKEIRSLEGESNHKVVDVWLLLIIHANGGPYRKLAEGLLKRKVVHGDFNTALIQKCLCGRGESLQFYFKTLLSVSESLLRTNEVATHDFGTHIYIILFEEFVSNFHRQEVLGSLITHIGSGLMHEVGAALDALLWLATKFARELIPLSSFMNGILDYLEGFQDSHLHKVYRMFSLLALVARFCGGLSNGVSVADDLLIVVRKQISNPDLKYKRMGIVGAVALISCLGQKITEEDRLSDHDTSVQGPRITEALTLLQMNMDACKASAVACSFFYDELAVPVESSILHASIIEWIAVQTEDFSTLYLGDLEGGQLQTEVEDSAVLQGEPWMNLDGNLSAIILNVLPLLIAFPNHSTSQPLLHLSANVRLLAAVERETNQGSLGSIDALLGCPLYLPKHQLLLGEPWKSLTRRQKELSCYGLFYSINWIRELINAFATQIETRVDDSSAQLTKEETTTKLLQRLRNLIFLEQLLNKCLKAVPYLSFPRLHSLGETPVALKLECKSGNTKKETVKAASKKGRKVGKKEAAQGKGDGKGNTQDCKGSHKMHQSSIQDAMGRAAGAGASQRSQQMSILAQGPSRSGASNSSALEHLENSHLAQKESCNSLLLDQQKWKFRALNLACASILTTHQNTIAQCCSDPSAQLPLHLYILQDLQMKLDTCLDQPARKLAPWMVAAPAPKAPSGLGGLAGCDVLKRLQPVFPSLKRHLDSAVEQLHSAGADPERTEADIATCQEHWNHECVAAGNPMTILDVSISVSETAQAVFMVILHCLCKILTYPELTLLANLPVLKELLSAFSSAEGANQMVMDLCPQPSPGSFEYVLCGTYAYLDSLHDAAAAASLVVAAELVMVLKALVNCAQQCLEQATEEKRKRSSSLRVPGLLPLIRTKLSNSAGRVLTYNSDAQEPWKSKGDLLQQLLHMLVQFNSSPIDLLEEIACTVLPQVPVKGSKGVPGYPALSPTTLLIWYRVHHEEVLILFNTVMKDILAQSKTKTSLTRDMVVKLLSRAHQCVRVHVALVNLTKSHDKSAIHAVAVKYGGKFVDAFLGGVEFLQAKYDLHKDAINDLVKELQKATRIIQALCSEAKGQKRMPVACKVPAVKRSMEKFVFCVKALLHGASHGNSFWMGNLKHKDVHGHEVSSQVHVSSNEDEEDIEAEDHESETCDEGNGIDEYGS